MADKTESILYFYVEKETAAKKRRWGKAKLVRFEIEDQKEQVLLHVCGIPEFYYKKRGWEQEVLKQCMEEAADAIRPDECIYSQSVGRLLGLYEKLPPAYLINKVLAANSCWETIILIGGEIQESQWEQEELEKEQELLLEVLAPYFPRINRMTIVTDWAEAYEEWTEWLYEEYGIPVSYSKKAQRSLMGRRKTAILDCRAAYEPLAALLPEDAIYIDFWSKERKEELLKRENPGISYLSPVKFLDTLVKNRYNTLVN